MPVNALADIYLEGRDLEKVDGELEKLFAVNDQDAEALILSARSKLAENRAEDAVTDLEEVLRKQPSLRDGLFYMAQTRLELGQIDQARAFIGDLVKYHPNHKKAALLNIQASFASNDPEAAKRAANELVLRTSRTFPTNAFKAQQTEQLRINGLTSRGLANLQLGNTPDALNDLQEVAVISPKSSRARVNLAKVHLALKNLPEAEKLYAAALDLGRKEL